MGVPAGGKAGSYIGAKNDTGTPARVAALPLGGRPAGVKKARHDTAIVAGGVDKGIPEPVSGGS